MCLCLLFNMELEVPHRYGLRDETKVTHVVKHCSKTEKGARISIRKDSQPHLNARFFPKTGHMSEQVLTLTLVADYSVLAVLGLVQEQLGEREYHRERAAAPALALFVIIRVGITKIGWLVRTLQ